MVGDVATRVVARVHAGERVERAGEGGTSARGGGGACTRRISLALASSVALGVGRARAVTEEDAFASVPRAPPEGECAGCVGEMNGFLNSCDAERDDGASCVSSQNDDAERFVNPWAHPYGGNRSDAMRALVETATGARRARGRAGPASERGEDEPLPFVARVEAFDEATGYVRLLLAAKIGETDERAMGAFDAEFLFEPNDEVVNVRVAERPDAATRPRRGKWVLDYTDLLKFDTNVARERAEALRVALGWENLPVIAAFDPKWSDKEQLWFERLFSAARGERPPDYDDLTYMRDAMSYE